MLTIYKMENGALKVDNMFRKLVGVDAMFEFRPSNYEINNSDAFLTARRITEKGGSSIASAVLIEDE